MLHNRLLAGFVGMTLLAWGAGEAVAQERDQRPRGLKITRVIPETTAAQEGLREGDIIVGVDGNAVRSNADLDRRLARVGYVAGLEIIDGSSGRVNRVSVYPVAGRIGVAAEPVVLIERAPVKQEEKPLPAAQAIWSPYVQQPFPTWSPPMNPYMMPWYPGLYPPICMPFPGCYPGMCP